MNTGNYNRSPGYGHGMQPGMHQRGCGGLLNFQRPQCSPARNFSTSSVHFGGVAPVHQPQASSATSGFMNGFKNFVQGIMHPNLNCDFYTDHHRYYNPKYRNNYMQDSKPEMTRHESTPMRPTPAQYLQTVFVDFRIGRPCGKSADKTMPKTDTNMKPEESKTSAPSPKPIPETEIIAIFTSEDFPELPAPRPCPSVTAFWAAQQEKSHKKSAQSTSTAETSSKKTQDTPKPQPKCSYFEIAFTTTPSKNRIPPKYKNCFLANNRKKESPRCDSEDEILVFSQSPAQNFNVLSSAGATPGRPSSSVFSSMGMGCRPPRQRQLSECSDDSFVICFTDDAAEGVIEFSDADDSSSYSASDSEEDSDEDISDDDDDDDVEHGLDVVDASPKIKTDSSKRCATALAKFVVDDNSQPDSGFEEQKEKRVRFDPKLVVHVMHAWNYAYRAARKGEWENFVHDRDRFNRRIKMTAAYLNPILDSWHREYIYKTRFCDNTSTKETASSTGIAKEDSKLQEI